MYIETQIKTRLNTNTSWCPDLETEYVRVFQESLKADGRLISIVHQLSEDQLQHTRTLIFRDRAARDNYFGNPIMATLEQRAADYDLTNNIKTRIVVDGE